ncbi:MAG TPA: LysE family translocator [Lapillicoccus sp.]|nr:LysE family translocator [Lapillicoccus sp.]
MELSAVLGFAAIAVTLVVVPGPDWAYVLAAGTRDHVVLPVVAGILLGYALVTAAVAAGVGPLVASAPAALTALTLAGAAYLTYLGVRTLRAPARVDAGPTEALASSRLRYLVRGVGVSSMNPKGLLIFLSVLPQFTRTVGWPAPLQLATLGGVFIAICALFYLPLGLAADRALGSRPGVAWVTSRVAGAAMVVVGLALLVERVVHLRG